MAEKSAMMRPQGLRHEALVPLSTPLAGARVAAASPEICALTCSPLATPLNKYEQVSKT